MPSGAKKRKAAKKKKELEANNSNSNSNSSCSSSYNPQEHDDAKSQDEKGSDGGEVSSPAHQDHHNNNNHPFNEGSEVKYSLAVRSVVVEDTMSMEKVPSAFEDKEGKEGGQDDDVAKVERGGSKSEEDSERSISIEGFEFSKISNDGDDNSSSSSSSGSSSDDESQATEKKEKQSEATKVAENESSGDANLVAQVSPIIESVKPVVPVSEETLSVIENAIVDNSLVSAVVKFENGAEKLANEVPETVTSFSPKKYEDKVFSLLDEYSKASPSELESESKVVEDKELPPSEHAHIAKTTTGAECNKDSEKEPLIAATPAPCLVQRTSWLSCCGIFELLSGSSR